MLVVKDAIIIPAEASNPPTSMTGRHPNLLTIMLQIGPGLNENEYTEH